MKCTSMSVAPLEDTTLTCHFPEDLSVTKKDFTVYHYVKGGSPGNDYGMHMFLNTH